MDNNKIIRNWFALSDYDVESAAIMLKSKRYLYVAFMCQQAIEKALKGIYVKETSQTPPYTHNLRKIASPLSFYDKFSPDQILFLDKLNTCYIESRYTETLQELQSEIKQGQAQEILIKSKEMLQWLETYKK